MQTLRWRQERGGPIPPEAAEGACARRAWQQRCLRFVVLVLLGGLAGCARIGVEQQGLVSKPNMTFSDSLVFSYQHKLLPQVEPGSAFSGGAQAAGCTSCK